VRWRPIGWEVNKMQTLTDDLTGPQRAAWELKYRRGWSTRRIANYLGTNRRAVQARLARARQQLGAPPARRRSLPRRRGVFAISLTDVINV